MSNTLLLHRSLGLFSLSLLLAACGTTSRPQQTASNTDNRNQVTALATPVAGQDYRIRNECSGKLLDVANSSLDDYGNVIQYQDTGGDNQRWILEATDSGFYKVIAKHSGKVLDVNGAGTADGTNIQQFTYKGLNNQQWRFTDLGTGYYEVSPRHWLNSALDVTGGSLANNANVELYHDIASSCAQHWKLEAVSSTPSVPSGYNFYVDVVNGQDATTQTGSSTQPFKTISYAVSRSTPSTSSPQSIYVSPGTYRETVSPKAYLTLQGATGAVIKGSDVVTDWVQSGAYWVKSNYTAFPVDPDVSRECRGSSNKRCVLPDQVFVDGQAQFQETTLSAVGAGDFFVDASTRTLYLGSNPAGKTVEVTTRNGWVVGDSTDTNVTVKGFTMTHAGNNSQSGGVRDGSASGWTVEGNDISYAHGANVRLDGSNAVLRNNKIKYAGQMGVLGGRTGVTGQVVEGNEIAYNNTEDFEPGWEAGGTKWVFQTNFLVQNNESHHNGGPGLWCDIDCGRNATTTSVIFRGNRLHHNTRQGLSYEISSWALIEDNVAWENGNGYDSTHSGFRTWGWGAGLLVQNSHHVTVRNNTVAWNADGISVVQQCRNDNGADCQAMTVPYPYHTRVDGVTVNNNVIAGTAYETQQNFLLAWLSDLYIYSKEQTIFSAGEGNTGSSNQLYGIARVVSGTSRLPTMEWTSTNYSATTQGVQDFSLKPGGQSSTLMTASEACTALSAKNVPCNPE